MPIDPNIPLSYRPPEIQNPLDAAGKVMNLQHMLQQTEVGKQTLQENDLKLSEMRRNLHDELTAREILSKHPDPKAAMKELYQRIGQNASKYVTAYANEATALSKLDEAGLDQAAKKLSYLGNSVFSLKDVDEEKKPAAYQQVLKTLVQGGIIKQEDIGQSIPAEYPGDEVVDLFGKIAMSTKDQIAAQTARIRAESYGNRVESLNAAALTKGQIDLGKLELEAQELQRKIRSDSALDERERSRIQNTLDVALKNIYLRKQEEEGRNKRAKEAEEGKTNRQESHDAAVSKRQQMLLEKGFTPNQVALAWSAAFKATGAEDLEDLDDDDVAALNALAESFLQLQQPQLGTQPGGFLGLGTSTTVQPGPQVNPRNTIHSTGPVNTTTNPPQPTSQQNTLPLEIINQMKVGVRTTLSDGSVWIKNADGTVTKAK
jgi:hypothetical protein